MTKVAVLAAVGALGLLAALDPPLTRAGDPAPVATTTVVQTVTARVEGLDVHQWRYRAVRNRRGLNRAHRENGRLRRVQARRYAPTVRYAIALARAVYGVDQTRRTFCESRNYVYAHNPSGASGPLQFLPSTWRSTPFAGFSVFDPVAAELAGGWMWAHGRSSEWACAL